MLKYSKEMDDVIRNFYPKFGSKVCADKLNVPVSSVRNRIFKLGIKKKTFEDDVFLSPSTPEEAYILGLGWADGHISENRFNIVCVKKDLKHIYPVFLKTGQWKISEKTPSQKNKQDISIARCNSKRIYKFLIEKDYISKSELSADKILSVIPKDLHPYWFRGLSDGDGCFCRMGKALTWSCYSSYNQNWEYLESLLQSLDIKYSIYKRERTVGEKIHRSSNIIIRGHKSVSTFGNYLYSNYKEDNIGFPRKYEKFLELTLQTP